MKKAMLLPSTERCTCSTWTWRGQKLTRESLNLSRGAIESPSLASVPLVISAWASRTISGFLSSIASSFSKALKSCSCPQLFCRRQVRLIGRLYWELGPLKINAMLWLRLSAASIINMQSLASGTPWLSIHGGTLSLNARTKRVWRYVSLTWTTWTRLDQIWIVCTICALKVF